MEYERIKYTKEEIAFRSKCISEMEKAKEQRDQSYAEFDDMNFLNYWESNARAANGYMPPKVDEQDVRVTTSTTYEKKNALLANILNLNLEPDIEAYNVKDQQLVELGQNMEDLVRKSRKVEFYDDLKRTDIYNEFISQGWVCVEDRFNEYRFKGKKLDGEFDPKSEDGMKWREDIDKYYGQCEAQLILGPNLYLGNIRESDIQKQPYVIVRRIMSRSEAESLYGKWFRWKNVPNEFQKLTNEEETDDLAYNDWTLEAFQKGFVEELRYFNRWTNDFQVFLNGMMMFPVYKNGTFPLSGINGQCKYPLAFSVAEKISNFAYGKSIPAKTKVDQALLDEMFKAVVIKTRKSYMPPLANNSGERLSKRIFWAGNITDDIDAEQIKEIGINQGVSPAEFNALQFMQGVISNKSVDPIMEGQSAGKRTATEIEEMKKQSMISIGLTILGVVSLERQLAHLRVMNVITNWTKPMNNDLKKKIYQSFSIESDFEDGNKGVKEIEFSEELPSDMQVEAEENIKKMTTGKNYRKVYINPKTLKQMELTWFIEINPTQKTSNALRRAQFEETIQKMLALFAPLGKMPNIEYLSEKWAQHAELDPERIWQQQEQGLPMPQGPAGPQGMPNELGAQLSPSAPPRPSVNTLERA